jgi:trehalose 6-phosphate synthase
VFELVGEINRKYGRPDWTPITVYHEQNRSKAMAGLSLYDVLLVNSVADGMNLVAKEGPILNERDGVLVLSINAGSHQELCGGALSIDPLDVGATAKALEQALEMPAAERKARADILKAAIERHQLSDWLRLQLKDLAVTEYVRGVAAPALAARA